MKPTHDSLLYSEFRAYALIRQYLIKKLPINIYKLALRLCQLQTKLMVHTNHVPNWENMTASDDINRTIHCSVR